MKKISGRIGFIIVFVILMLFVVLPIYWMVVTSLKPNHAAFNIPPSFIPVKATLENYISQIADQNFIGFFLNSVIVSLATTVLSIAVAILGGYAFSRYRFPFKRSIFTAILVSQMFPLTLLIIGMYTFFRQLNLLNTYWGLILAFTSFSLPFAIWMMEGFFNSIPRQLDEAAMIDGASRLGTLWRVVIPLTRPGMIAVGVFSFLNSWNNLLFALSLTSSIGKRTIPPGFLLSYVGEFQYYWSNAMAGSVIVTIPMVVVFILLQRYLVQGMMAGAVKQ